MKSSQLANEVVREVGKHSVEGDEGRHSDGSNGLSRARQLRASGQTGGKDRLEGRPVSVEEELVRRGVVEAHPLTMVAEQCRRMAVEQRHERLELQAADVDAQSATEPARRRGIRRG